MFPKSLSRTGIIAIAIVCIIAAFTGCSSPEKPAPVTASSAAVQTPEEKPVSYDGEWKDGELFEATVANDTIEIYIVADATKSLYWTGTFPAGDDERVTSAADTEKLAASMMGSQDAEKVFERSDDSISFEFTMMGTTKSVTLKR